MTMYLGSNPVAITNISSNKYDWLGPNIENLGTIYEWTGTLDDTSYAGWTPSTTASIILPSQSNVTTITIPDRTTNTYYIVARRHMTFAYDGNETSAALPTSFSRVGVYMHYNSPTPGVVSQYISGEYDSYSSVLTDMHSTLVYYNTSGTLTANSISYGPAYTTTSGILSISSTTGNQVIFSYASPDLNARCDTSYFSIENAACVDTTNSTIKYRLDLLKGPIDNAYTQRYRWVTGMLNDNWDV